MNAKDPYVGDVPRRADCAPARSALVLSGYDETYGTRRGASPTKTAEKLYKIGMNLYNEIRHTCTLS